MSNCLNLALELRESHRGWMKPISYRSEIGDTERICTWEDLIGSCSISHLLKVKVQVQVAQSCPTLCDPMDCTVHGILQARILGWVAFPFSRGSSQPRDWTLDCKLSEDRGLWILFTWYTQGLASINQVHCELSSDAYWIIIVLWKCVYVTLWKIFSSVRLIFITSSLSMCLNFLAVSRNDDIVGDFIWKGSVSLVLLFELLGQIKTSLEKR